MKTEVIYGAESKFLRVGRANKQYRNPIAGFRGIVLGKTTL